MCVLDISTQLVSPYFFLEKSYCFNCLNLHPNLTPRNRIGKISKVWKSTGFPLRGSVWPPYIGRSDRRQWAGQTGGVWPVWPQSPSPSLFCRVSRFPCSGRHVWSFLWILSWVGRGGGPIEGNTNPNIRDKAGSIVKTINYQSIESFFYFCF